MSKISSFIFVSASSLFIACSGISTEKKNSLMDFQTEEFASYLNNNFGDSIEAKHHLYLLVAKKDSPENIATILNTLHKWAIVKSTKNTSTIASVKIPVPDSLVIDGNKKTDWDAAIDQLKLPLSGVTIIRTADKKVEKIFPLTIENVKEEIDLLNW